LRSPQWPSHLSEGSNESLWQGLERAQNSSCHMTGGRRAFLIVATLILAAAPVAAWPQTRDARPNAAQATGEIAGTVVGSESGRPVAFASIILRGGPAELAAATDFQGQFSLSKVPAGSYTLHVSKPGYVDTTFGQTRPGTNTPGRRIVLADRQRLTGLPVVLSQGSSVAGVIRSASGEPLYKAMVRVSRWATTNGLRTLETVATAETDDRGSYRVPLLPPRHYLISVDPAEVHRDRPAAPLASVFYPQALSADAATSIQLAPDDHRTGLDMVLPTASLSRVIGTVLDEAGRPAEGVSVAISGGTQSPVAGEQGTSTDANGKFEFGRLPPGPYVIRSGERFPRGRRRMEFGSDGFVTLTIASGQLSVNANGQLSVNDSSTTGAPRTGSAAEEIVVGSAPEMAVVLQLLPPRALSGRILFDGRSARPKPSDLAIQLVAADSDGDFDDFTPSDDGLFAVSHVAPGRYRVGIDVPQPWFLLSAISGGVDTLDLGIVVPRDRDISDLVVTVSDRGPELSGSVRDAAGRAVTDRTVVVFSAEPEFWGAGTRRVQSAELDADGRYHFRGLAPGAYRIAVVDAVEPNEWLDPAVLRQWLPITQPISLRLGEKQVQDFRVK
jgi:hypothetical protein